MIEPLAKALMINREELDQAIKLTSQIVQEEFDAVERPKFRPHLMALCKNGNRPTPLFVGRITFHHRFVYFKDDFENLPLEGQIQQA